MAIATLHKNLYVYKHISCITWILITAENTFVVTILSHIIVFASLQLQQLEVERFHIIIPVICYSCWSWLENKWHQVFLKTCKTKQIKIVDELQHVYRAFMGTGCFHWCARQKYFVVCKLLLFIHKIYYSYGKQKFVYYPSKWTSAYHEDWIGLDAQKYLSSDLTHL